MPNPNLTIRHFCIAVRREAAEGRSTRVAHQRAQHLRAVERVAEGAEAQRVQVAAHLAHLLLLGAQQRLGDGQQRREALMQRVGVRLRETLIVYF